LLLLFLSRLQHSPVDYFPFGDEEAKFEGGWLIKGRTGLKFRFANSKAHLGLLFPIMTPLEEWQEGKGRREQQTFTYCMHSTVPSPCMH
jgi:hypothetical protein